MKRLLTVIVLAALAASATEIRDTLQTADFRKPDGEILITWPAFTSLEGVRITEGRRTYRITRGQITNLHLAPNPNTVSYTVTYTWDDGLTYVEYWQIPISATPLTVAAVRSDLPVSPTADHAGLENLDYASAGHTGFEPNIAGGTTSQYWRGDKTWTSVDWSHLANVPSTFAPSAHASSHQNGGGDEIATATPAANAIPKAGAGSTLDAGWIPDLSSVYAALGHNHSGVYEPVDATIVRTGQANTYSTGLQNFAAATLRVPMGATPPGTCGDGDIWYDTDASTGQRWLICETDTWTLQGGGGGSSTFTGLTDTPSSYSGQALKVVRVNSGETGLEFSDAGQGDVAGPASSTDNAIARYHSTTGKIIQTSAASIDDDGFITEGIGWTAGYVKEIGNAGDTGASAVMARSGNGASNTKAGYLGAYGSPSGLLSHWYPCMVSGLWCPSATTPAADSADFAVTLLNNSGVSSDGSDTYTATTAPAWTSYTPGAWYRLKVATANTGSASVNYNTIGAVTIRYVSSGSLVDLANNCMVPGIWYWLNYDGTYVQLSNPSCQPAPSIGEDSITTTELDDGSDTPAQYERVRVASGAAEFEYSVRTDTFGCVFDGGGETVTQDSVCYSRVPRAGVIVGWSIVAQGSSPTATIDAWKVASGTALPTNGNSITASAPMALATGNAIKSTALTGWTTTVTADDIVGFNVDAVANATWLEVRVYYEEH